jgi:D-arabinose 1-dehydrogenase-like Zn-dependent alcohol dehydrogenase
VKPGDTVVLHWRPSQGIQCQPPAYQWRGKKLNAGWVTTFNDYAVVSENRMTVIPPDYNLRDAPLLGCAVTTAAGVINNDANVKIGESVVIFGEDECRAWTIQLNTRAQNGAGAIHSDLEKHFIRAETIRWDQLLEAGSEANARAKGTLRLEGKDYIVQDGDVMHIRHSG